MGRSTGARAIHQPLGALVGKAVDPFPQGRSGNVPRVGDRWETLPLDDVAHGLGTAEDPRLLWLFQEGLQSGYGIIGKVPFEGPQTGRLQNNVRQK